MVGRERQVGNLPHGGRTLDLVKFLVKSLDLGSVRARLAAWVVVKK